MPETLILSLYPSDSFPHKGLECIMNRAIDKNYQVLEQKIDPLRFRGVECCQGKGSTSQAFSFLRKRH